MDNNDTNQPSECCRPTCDCNSPKGPSLKTKITLLVIILIVAGAVLANSILKKSRVGNKASQSGYMTSALCAKPDGAAPPVGTQQATPSNPAVPNVTFKELASLGSLDTVAANLDGVFVLLANSETEKSPAIVKEISTAMATITSRGVRMSAFQLNKNAPDFTTFKAQLPPPSVLVLARGKGMRGVKGEDIAETKLLQAWVSAMQPTGCCPGGSRTCK
jgi:hypothetical protein